MPAFPAKFQVTCLLALSLSVSMGSSHAQLVSTDPDWQEIAVVPAPPALNGANLKQLVPFEVSAYSDLRWSVVPASIQISGDGLVRYVVVAQSASGLINALYETINCNKAEFKTHARYNANGGWVSVGDPQWRSMYDNLPSKHALMLAKQGACVGNAPAQNATDMVQALKKTSASTNER